MDEEDRLDFGEEEDLEDQISLGEADTTDAQTTDTAAQTRDNSTSAIENGGRSSSRAATESASATVDAGQNAVSDAENEAPLPPGWVARLSRQGELYYLHEPTKQSTWDRPTAPIETETPATNSASPLVAPTSGAVHTAEAASSAMTQANTAEVEAQQEEVSSVSQEGTPAARWGRQHQPPQQQAFGAKGRVASTSVPSASVRSAREVAAMARNKQTTPLASAQGTESSSIDLQRSAAPLITSTPTVNPSRNTGSEERPDERLKPTKAGNLGDQSIPTGPKADRMKLEQRSLARGVGEDRSVPSRPPSGPAAERSKAAVEPASASRSSAGRDRTNDSGWPKRDNESERRNEQPMSAPAGSSRHAGGDPRDHRYRSDADDRSRPDSSARYEAPRPLSTVDRSIREPSDRRAPLPQTARAPVDRGWPKRDVEDRRDAIEAPRDSRRPPVSPPRRPLSPEPDMYAPTRPTRPRSPLPSRLVRPAGDGPVRLPDAREVARAAGKKGSASPHPTRQWGSKQPSPVTEPQAEALKGKEPSATQQVGEDSAGGKENAGATRDVSKVEAVDGTLASVAAEQTTGIGKTRKAPIDVPTLPAPDISDSKGTLTADKKPDAQETAPALKAVKAPDLPKTTAKTGPVRPLEKRKVSENLASRLDAPLADVRPGLSIKRTATTTSQAGRRRSPSPPPVDRVASSSTSLAERMGTSQPSLLARMNGDQDARRVKEDGGKGRENGRPNKRTRLEERLAGNLQDTDMAVDESNNLGSRLGESSASGAGRDTSDSKGLSIFGAGRAKELEDLDGQSNTAHNASNGASRDGNKSAPKTVPAPALGIAGLPSKPIVALPRTRESSNPALLDSYRPGPPPRRDSGRGGPPPIRDSYVPSDTHEKVIDRYVPPRQPEQGPSGSRGGMRGRPPPRR